MAADQLTELTITLDGPGIGEDGIEVGDVATALEGVQGALRLMVEHLGGREPSPGPAPKWIRDQSSLRLTATRWSSFAATLRLKPPADGQVYLDDLGPPALAALSNWDGHEDSSLPRPVTDQLYAIPAKLSPGARFWLGSPDNQCKIEVKRIERAESSELETQDALIYGWLKEVNWDRRTAQLYDFTGSYIRLRFDPTLNEEMIRLATRYVEVRGSGRINVNDDWTSVQVERISATDSGEPFDVDAFINDPNPKVFDPDQVVTASEPFNVEDFIRIIHEGRDARQEES